MIGRQVMMRKSRLMWERIKSNKRLKRNRNFHQLDFSKLTVTNSLAKSLTMSMLIYKAKKLKLSKTKISN